MARDPLLPIRAVFDLGGSGARADAMAIWLVQWVGQEIRVLDYIEGIGQVLAHYVTELRSKGYQSAVCILPHDGVNENNITGKRYEDHLRDAGFEVVVVPNQGRRRRVRIEAVRRISKIWFNEATTEAGRDALGYHERRTRRGRSASGPRLVVARGRCLMAVAYEDHRGPARNEAAQRARAARRLDGRLTD